MMSDKSKQAEKKIVLKLLPEYIVVTTSLSIGDATCETQAIQWKLAKKINPNDINQDLEVLTLALVNMVSFYNLEGSIVTFVIPHSLAPCRVIEIPMNLKSKADLKEFNALTKTNAFDFWKEHDPDLAGIKHAEIRSNLISSSDEDNASRLLYCSVPTQSLKDYITFILGGSLYPVNFISEDQSLIRIVESRLTRVERERPFCIFHFAKGNSRLIYLSPETMEVVRVNIDELDEILIDDLPGLDQTNNVFWNEVMGRFSNALKQAVNFLNQELRVTKFDTIYFVTEYGNEQTLFELFRASYRLTNFKSMNQQFEFINYRNEFSDNMSMEKDNDLNVNNYRGQFISNLGAYKMNYFSTPSIPNEIIGAPMLNFHPSHNFIENNFKVEPKVTAFLKISFLIALVIIAVSVFLNLTTDKGTEYQEKYDQLNSQAKQVGLLKAEASKMLQMQTKILASVQQIAAGNSNETFFHVINYKLPPELELERLLINQSNFDIAGNGLNLAAINNFYEAFLDQSQFQDTELLTYKRLDNNLHFFRIKGALVTKND